MQYLISYCRFSSFTVKLFALLVKGAIASGTKSFEKLSVLFSVHLFVFLHFSLHCSSWGRCEILVECCSNFILR